MTVGDAHGILLEYCRAGALSELRTWAAVCGLEAESDRVNDNKALGTCCEHGHLSIAQWLVSTFGLTARDARSCGNEALCTSCGNSHLATAQWLAERFGLTARDARFCDNEALHLGHLAVAKWLVKMPCPYQSSPAPELPKRPPHGRAVVRGALRPDGCRCPCG
jgi:hypothetical protein